MSTVLMGCGHAANAVDGSGNPCCVICFGDPRARTVVEKPSLEGRRSKCGDCDEIVPSNWDLPFFEFRGEGSVRAQEICANCRYSIVAHTDEKRKRVHSICAEFVAHGPFELDGHYNGCKGWD